VNEAFEKQERDSGWHYVYKKIRSVLVFRSLIFVYLRKWPCVGDRLSVTTIEMKCMIFPRFFLMDIYYCFTSLSRSHLIYLLLN